MLACFPRWITFLVFLMLAVPLFSQEGQETEVFQDAQLWLRAKLEYKVSKKLEVSLTEEIRFDENYGQLSTVVTKTQVSYDLNKYFSLYGRYAFYLRPSTENRHRILGGVIVEKGFGDFDLALRSGIQRDYVRFSLPDHDWRNKVELEYSRKKFPFKPFIYTEWFYHFDYNYRSFNKYRVGLGTDYKVKKRRVLTLKYFYQRVFDTNSPEIGHILFVGYSFGIKRKKKKKK